MRVPPVNRKCVKCVLGMTKLEEKLAFGNPFPPARVEKWLQVVADQCLQGFAAC